MQILLLRFEEENLLGGVHNSSLPSSYDFITSYPFSEATNPDPQDVRKLLALAVSPDVRKMKGWCCFFLDFSGHFVVCTFVHQSVSFLFRYGVAM